MHAPPPNYLFSRLPVLLCSLCMFTVSNTQAATVHPDEMSRTRRWAAAKFEGVQKQPEKKPGLVVIVNNGPVLKNGRLDEPLNINGAEFKRGLFCHAPSKIVVRLPGPGKSFSAMAGVDSNYMTKPGRGSVVVSVKIGDKQAFRSELMREGMKAVPVDVDLGSATEFTLEIQDAGDGISCDQTDWADARVVLADGKTVWLADMPLVEQLIDAFTTDLPFSFTYAGRPSGEFLKDWKCQRESRKLDAKRTQHIITYTDPKTGLVVRQVAVEYHDFPTVEWTLYFKNTGNKDTPILESIQALDTRFQRGAAGEFVLHHLRGDSCTANSFEPLATTLGPKTAQRFAPTGGRPTNGEWPYYNINWNGKGLIAVIGWPGQWAAEFTRDAACGLRIRGGQERNHFKLLPGEEVRSPLVALQFYEGDRTRAQNIWRRWILVHNLPRPGGKLPQPILSSCSGGFFPGLMCNEADEKRFIDTFAAEGIKLDYWWMDAGWYPCEGVGWPKTGTWEVDRKRFPKGIRAVSDHARSKGMKHILWFEPERVHPGTELYEKHPQWLLGTAGQQQKLLNLGNPEARKWLTDHIDKMLTEQGIDLYRQDYNIDPLAYWHGNDAKDRQGITEIRHVEGYLAYWDELRRRHPGMLIDSCASGGRRNDLETMRRALPLLRSDYHSFQGDSSFAPGNQGQTYGLASWLPFFGTGVYYNNKEHPVYVARSSFCPGFGYCRDIRQKGTDWDLIRRLTGNWHTISRYFFGDYYPLTKYSLADDLWIAWQFHLANEDEGVIQAFRRTGSVYESARLKLYGLDPEAQYTITNLDSPEKTKATGRQLMEEGLLVVSKECPGAPIITYK